MLRDDAAVVDAVAEWLYDRVMDERQVWYEEQGWSYTPPFKDCDEQTKDWWRDDADKLLAIIEKAIR